MFTTDEDLANCERKKLTKILLIFSTCAVSLAYIVYIRRFTYGKLAYKAQATLSANVRYNEHFCFCYI